MIEDRYKRRHPKFPGVARCLELLRRRNVQGDMVEIIYAELRDHAAGHAKEMIDAFRTEENERVRRLILEAFSEAKAPEALPLFVEQLHSADEGLRLWSERGLRELNSPEARKALWEAGLPRKA